MAISEVQILVYTILLGFLHIGLATMLATKVRGAQWNTSARDQEVSPLKGVPARADRALQNFKETFPFFAAAVLVVTVSGRANEWSQIGSYLYFGARIVYLPIYLAGIPVVRTLVWGISMLGILLVLISAL